MPYSCPACPKTLFTLKVIVNAPQNVCQMYLIYTQILHMSKSYLGFIVNIKYDIYRMLRKYVTSVVRFCHYRVFRSMIFHCNNNIWIYRFINHKDGNVCFHLYNNVDIKLLYNRLSQYFLS